MLAPHRRWLTTRCRHCAGPILVAIASLMARASPAQSLAYTTASADTSASRPLAAWPESAVRAWQAGMLRPDRVQHASVSFTLAAALLLATRSRTASAAGTLALGIGKELWDTRSASGFDPVDLAADGVGITLACIAVRAR